MTSTTEHFDLTKLDPDEGIHAGDGHFASADRDKIDQGIYNATYHHHVGEDIVEIVPDLAPDLTLNSTGGTLPAGTVITYAYTYTDPETGETIPSPSASVTTPDAFLDPEAPTFTLQAIGGTLEPGQYFYALSFYQGSSTVETKATNALSVEVPVGTSTNEITLTMPDNPSGATGFNVYRRGPGQTQYYFLDSVTGTTYVDGGEDETLRGLPTENTTNATYSVDVEVPEAIPADNLWNLYRTYSAASWQDSYLTTQDESDLTYTDIGDSTTAGAPPTGMFGAPSKVMLTDAAEVQGVLPIENGGTSGTTDTEAREALGLEIGVDVQAHSAVLDATTASFTTADETKLDGIEADATADQTAADVPITDSGGFFTATDVEGPLQEVGGATAPNAADVSITDTGGYFTGDDVEEALQELGAGGGVASHTGDTTDAHDASAISIVDTGDFFTATDVEEALQELGAGGDLASHTGDTTDAHDASAISIADSGGHFTATDVEEALQELASGGASYAAIVDHGGTAGTARPGVTGPVLWRGIVEPTNADNGDDWLDYS